MHSDEEESSEEKSSSEENDEAGGLSGENKAEEYGKDYAKESELPMSIQLYNPDNIYWEHFTLVGSLSDAAEDETPKIVRDYAGGTADAPSDQVNYFTSSSENGNYTEKEYKKTDFTEGLEYE